MAKIFKVPGASSQTPLGWSTAPPAALCDFHFHLKTLNVCYGLCPFKVYGLPRTLSQYRVLEENGL